MMRIHDRRLGAGGTLALLLALLPTAPAAGQEIDRISPSSIELEPGGSPVKVTLSGRGVENLDGARVLYRGRTSRAIEASLLRATRRGQRTLRLEADRRAPEGTYAVEVSAPRLRRPLSLRLRLEVRAPRRSGSRGSRSGSGGTSGDGGSPPPDDGDIMPQSISVGPGTLEHGESGPATVVVSRGPAADLVLNLTSSHPAALQVPTTITVQAGSQTAHFTVTAGTPVHETEATVTVTRPPYPTGLSDAVTVLGTPAQVTSLEPGSTCPSNSWGCTGQSYDDHLWKGGTQKAFRIGLSPAPGPDGAQVALSTDRPDALEVPATLAVDHGDGEAFVTVHFGEVQDTVRATLTASLNGGSASYDFTVIPFSYVDRIELPGAISGGQEGTGSLVLYNASNGTRHVPLASSDPLLADVPASVEVAPGVMVATFPISTSPVAQPTQVTISANDGARAAVTSVVPPQPASFSLPASVSAGETVTATLQLDGVVTGGDLTFPMTSSDPDVVQPPASVTVPANAYEAAFQVGTSNHEDFDQAERTVTVGLMNPASPQEAVAEATLVVERSIGLLDGLSLPGGSSVEADTTFEVVVELDGPAGPGGMAIGLTSDDPVVTVPSSVTVPQGMDQASFTATSGAADQFTSVRLEAQDERGRIASGNVSVQPPLSLTGVEALQPGSEVVGGTSLTLRVELNRIPPAAVSVALSSDDPAVQLPASVDIAGSRRVSVTATTAQVDQQTTVGIDATWDGATAGTTVTLLPPPPLVGLTFTPAEVLGGESSTGTLSIGYPGDEPLEVTLSSSNSAKVQTPGSMVIPAGQTSATFDVTTSSAQAGTVTIEAELGSSQVSEELVVAPLDVRLLELEPSASVAVSGTTLTLTLRVKGQGASGGTVIEVASSHPELLPAPATVTLPQGQSGVTFQVTVQDVEAAQAVTLSATHADTTVETTIMLSP